MTEDHLRSSDEARHPHTSDLEPPRFTARFFGPFQVLRNGVPLDDAAGLGRTSARTLLKWFLLNPGVRVESPELYELLWPVRRARSNPNRLHVTLHYLRHLLEPGLNTREPSTFIRSDHKGLYWFDFADRWRTDALEVDQLLAAGRDADTAGDLEQAIRSYEILMDYYERTFLPENLFDEAFAAPRTAYEVAHREVEMRLLQLYLVRGLNHKALPIALSALDRDPYSEAAAVAIAEVSLRQGNTLAARTQLAGYLETIRRELGVNPSGHALRLWERIQRAG